MRIIFNDATKTYGLAKPGYLGVRHEPANVVALLDRSKEVGFEGRQLLRVERLPHFNNLPQTAPIQKRRVCETIAHLLGEGRGVRG